MRSNSCVSYEEWGLCIIIQYEILIHMKLFSKRTLMNGHAFQFSYVILFVLFGIFLTYICTLNEEHMLNEDLSFLCKEKKNYESIYFSPNYLKKKLW